MPFIPLRSEDYEYYAYCVLPTRTVLTFLPLLVRDLLLKLYLCFYHSDLTFSIITLLVIWVLILIFFSFIAYLKY